jgi:penicillin amidase
MKIQLFVLSLAIVLLSACNNEGPGNAENPSEQVTIYRDAYGTPQIVADSNAGVYFGYGYAVATDRLFQMEMLKRTAQGRVAEVLGEDFVELDIQLRTSYDHRSIARQLEALPAPQLEILQAYAQGFNSRIDELTADTMPVEFADNDFLPQHWSAYDVAMIFVGSLAHRYSDFNSERDNLQLLQHLDGLHGKATAWKIFNASKWLLDKDSPTTVPGPFAPGASSARPDYLNDLPTATATTRVVLRGDGKFNGSTNSTEKLKASRARLADIGFSQNPEFTGASNYWAAQDLQDAPAALVNGPQFGFGVPSYVYGIGLHGGDFNVVGNTLLALPSLLFAHNNHIAWGSTAGISDQSDEFRLSLDPGNADRYRHGEAWHEFESWPEHIAVKGKQPITVVARRSAQGMVQSYQPENDIAWARARSWEGEELATLMAWIFLATDTNIDSAKQRIGEMSTNINMYLMDKTGNLSYVHSGRYPQRAANHDSRLPAPGNGAWDWQGMRPYSDNPTVTNPKQGFIANWNNRPRADWISSDLWTYTWSRADRVQLIFDALHRDPQSTDAKPTIASVSDINKKLAFADVNAPFLLPYLFSAWDDQAPSKLASIALKALQDWDEQWPVDANAQYGAQPAIMEMWLKELLKEVFEDDIGGDYLYLYSATNYPNNRLGASMGTAPGTKVLLRNLDRLASGRWNETDYDFFNGRKPAEVINHSFQRAIERLVAEQGPILSQWHLQAHPMQWQPYNFRGVPQAREDAGVSLPAYMNRGSENNLFIATGDGIVARDVIPPGQSGFQGIDGARDKNTANQMNMYADFEYKDVPFAVEQIRKHATSTQTLSLPTITRGQTTMPTLSTALQQLQNSSATSKDLVEKSLAKIADLKRLNAFITVDTDGAKASALGLDEMRNNGETLGPLAGVPMSVKDNIHVAGLPNTAGTAALRHFTPTKNAAVIDRLKAAGAVIIGKNNMHELAYGITSDNYTFGAVGNAYDASYIAGGSSGGTAVAIASGMVSAGLGTDTGGSTRIPASLNGIAGFRPTTGRYPSAGLTRISNTRDTVGPMAKTVVDIALLDSVLSGESADNQSVSLSGLRLGVPRSYFYNDLEPTVATRADTVLQMLRDVGVILIEADIPDVAELNEKVGFPLVIFETKQLLEDYAARNISGGSLQTIIEQISSPDVKGVMEAVVGGAIPESVYRDALEVFRPQLQQAYSNYFATHKVDAVIFPTLPLTARPIEGSVETVEFNGIQAPTFPTYIRNTDPASNAGIPALTIPAGISMQGFPIGMEIDGPHGSDRRLLAIGVAIEEMLSSDAVTRTPAP